MSPAFGSLDRRGKVGTALVALGVVLLIAPALVPVQPVLFHNTHPSATGNASELQEQGLTIVAYEDLSERGQELYVTTLREGGRYTAPMSAGASEFPYPTQAELGNVSDYRQRQTMSTIVIERPDDADLPPPGEHLRAAEYGHDRDEEEGTPSEAEIEERRQQIARYDLMSTRTDSPPLSGPQHLLRLLALVASVIAIGTGGYLLSSP